MPRRPPFPFGSRLCGGLCRLLFERLCRGFFRIGGYVLKAELRRRLKGVVRALRLFRKDGSGLNCGGGLNCGLFPAAQRHLVVPVDHERGLLCGRCEGNDGRRRLFPLLARMQHEEHDEREDELHESDRDGDDGADIGEPFSKPSNMPSKTYAATASTKTTTARTRSSTAVPLPIVEKRAITRFASRAMAKTWNTISVTVFSAPVPSSMPLTRLSKV